MLGMFGVASCLAHCKRRVLLESQVESFSLLLPSPVTPDDLAGLLGMLGPKLTALEVQQVGTAGARGAVADWAAFLEAPPPVRSGISVLGFSRRLGGTCSA